MKNSMVFFFKNGSSWIKFDNPCNQYIVYKADEVLPALEKLDHEIEKGFYIAGFLSYEAASAIDDAYRTKKNKEFPLLAFGVFKEFKKVQMIDSPGNSFKTGSWSYSQNAEYYNHSIARIKKYIQKGDTYQVNYTFRLQSSFSGDPLTYFVHLHSNQNSAYSGFINIDNYSICSASPELFFKLEGDKIISIPMKGTAKRGLSYQDDLVQKKVLKNSEKERAENLMIVDMIRNDMGKICDPDTVQVNNLFNVERYPTVWQMTSEVQGKTSVGFSQIIKALFPCASITGAPKVRTMEIINNLEKYPRNIYTGTLGFFSPDRKAVFNVAIRTALIDKKNNSVQYGVGSGIVWDSVAKNEYDECKNKAAILNRKKVKFDLLETMLFEKDEGIFLLDYHLNRMQQSAEYFGYPFHKKLIIRQLEKKLKGLSAGYKVRLLISANGGIQVQRFDLNPISNSEFKNVRMASNAVDQNNIFLYHKTTNREVYESAIRQINNENLDDIILYNKKGEITESTIANVVVKIDHTFYTPPIECGLLNGTFRKSLIDQKMIKEKKLLKNDLLEADKIFLINSLQKWHLARILP